MFKKNDNPSENNDFSSPEQSLDLIRWPKFTEEK